MDHRKRSIDIVERAEREVLSILAEEAKAASYEGIEFARLVAMRLRDLRNALEAGGSKGVEDGKQTSRLNVTKETSRKRSKKKQRKAGPYPKFQILDGTLVKVGWSKRGKAEYHQRIPEGAFHRVTSALGELSSVGNGSRPSDEILAMVDTGGEAIPSYQTYAVLRFLRDRGVIRMASRGEYVIPPDVTERARTAFVGTEATS